MYNRLGKVLFKSWPMGEGVNSFTIILNFRSAGFVVWMLVRNDGTYEIDSPPEWNDPDKIIAKAEQVPVGSWNYETSLFRGNWAVSAKIQ